jgi:hypothetical protein
MPRELWIPPPDVDLVGDLVYVPDPSLGDPYGDGMRRAGPMHLRLYVAAWMLSNGNRGDFMAALREAYALYDGSGTGLLDQPRVLTTADIVAEVIQLTRGAP